MQEQVPCPFETTISSQQYTQFVGGEGIVTIDLQGCLVESDRLGGASCQGAGGPRLDAF